MSARLYAVAALAALTIGAGATAAHADTPSVKADTPSSAEQKVLLKGATTASYFWDDSSGRAGDTGLPASGKPMQKGLAASPSWPLMTEGYVVYKGKKMPFFVGDRGPGDPSSTGVMLDLDAKTFADLTGGSFNPSSLGVDGNGGEGHIKVDYVITKWGDGVGRKNVPVAFSTGAWARKDANPAKPPQILAEKKADKKVEEPTRLLAEKPAPGAANPPELHGIGPARVAAMAERDVDGSDALSGAVVAGGLAMAGGGMVFGRDRLRKLVRR
jgi:hypothetical protein